MLILPLHCRFKIFTVRKRSCGNVMFSQACVTNSVHKGGRMSRPRPWWRGGGVLTRGCPGPGLGVCIPACIETDTPSRQLLLRTGRILLECILVFKCSYKFVNSGGLRLCDSEVDQSALIKNSRQALWIFLFPTRNAGFFSFLQLLIVLRFMQYIELKKTQNIEDFA